MHIYEYTVLYYGTNISMHMSMRSFIENSSLYDTVHHKVRSHVILIIILYNGGKPFSCDDKTV